MRASQLAICVALLVLLLVASGAAEAQCALCRNALASDGFLAAAFRRAIWFLLVVPFGCVAAVALLIRRERRRRSHTPS